MGFFFTARRENILSKKIQSPRTKQRVRVFEDYRGRGHQNNNLWLIYSVKTQRDWIIPSDRQLIHWIHYLETAPLVKSFDLTPEEIVSSDDKDVRVAKLDAEVLLLDGRKEWHVVKSAEVEKVDADLQTKYRIFTDAELRPYVKTSMRWLKALSFAATIRDQDHTPSYLALLNVLKSRVQGTVREIIEDLVGYDQPVLNGLLVRLAIERHVQLDLGAATFCYSTPWHWIGEE